MVPLWNRGPLSFPLPGPLAHCHRHCVGHYQHNEKVSPQYSIHKLFTQHLDSNSSQTRAHFGRVGCSVLRKIESMAWSDPGDVIR